MHASPETKLNQCLLCPINRTDSQNPDESVGEISVQIDLFTHPGTGEHKVTVKGMVFQKQQIRPKFHIKLWF